MDREAATLKSGDFFSSVKSRCILPLCSHFPRVRTGQRRGPGGPLGTELQTLMRGNKTERKTLDWHRHRANFRRIRLNQPQ